MDQYFLVQYFFEFQNGAIFFWTISFKSWKRTNIFGPILWYWSKVVSTKITKISFRAILQAQKLHHLITSNTVKLCFPLVINVVLATENKLKSPTLKSLPLSQSEFGVQRYLLTDFDFSNILRFLSSAQYFLDQYFGIFRNGPILLRPICWDYQKWTNIGKTRPIFWNCWNRTNNFRTIFILLDQYYQNIGPKIGILT